MQIYVYLYVSLCIYIYVYVYIYICICICICIYALVRVPHPATGSLHGCRQRSSMQLADSDITADHRDVPAISFYHFLTWEEAQPKNLHAVFGPSFPARFSQSDFI